jgi:hypothetical protein
MSRNNRELSQFASYLHIEDLELIDDGVSIITGRTAPYDGVISIGTTLWNDNAHPPNIGIGTTLPASRVHIAVGITDVIISGGRVTSELGQQVLTGGGLLLDGDIVSKGGALISGNTELKANVFNYGDTRFGRTVTLNPISGNPVDGSLFAPGLISIGLTTPVVTGTSTVYSDTRGLVNLSNTTLYGNNVFTGITTISNNLRIVPTYSTSSVSTGTTTGLFVVEGSVGISSILNVQQIRSPEVFVSSLFRLPETSTFISATDNTIFESAKFNKGIDVSGISTFQNILYVSADNDANSLTEGAIYTDGGIAIAKKLQVGGASSIFGRVDVYNDITINASEIEVYSDSIVLGSNDSSLLTVQSKLNSGLIPATTDVYDLGSEAFRWNYVRANTGTYDNLSADVSLTVLGTVAVGGTALFTNGINVSGAKGTFELGIAATSNSTFFNQLTTGIAAFNNDIQGTATTSIRATAIDVSTASTETSYYLTFVDSQTPQQQRTVFVDGGIYYTPLANTLSVDGDILMDGSSLGAITNTEFLQIFNNDVTSISAFGEALSVSMGSTVGFTTIKSTQTDFSGNIRLVGNGSTAAIKASNGLENITLTGNTLTEFSNNISIYGNSFNVQNSSFNLARQNVTNVYAFDQAFEIVIGGITGITSIVSPLTVFGGDIRILGDDIQASDGQVNMTLFGSSNTRFAGNIQVDGSNILTGGGTTNITMVSGSETIFAGDIRVNGNDIKASDGNVNITMTSNTQTSITGQLRVESNEIVDSGDQLNITLGTNFVEFADDIKINGNNIKASDNSTNITLEGNIRTIFAGNVNIGGDAIETSDGVEAITLTPVTGSVGITSDLVIENDLILKGSDAIIKSDVVKIKDNLINIGLRVDPLNDKALIEPTSDNNYDVGLIMNYYDSTYSVARKASIFWDDSRSKVAIASTVTESSNVLSISQYATIDIANINVNDCAGSSEILSCSASTRNLVNLTIDGGEY